MTEATGRVSNKQILTALNDLPAAIANAIQGTAIAAPAVSAEAETAPVSGETVKAKLDPGYLAHVSGQLQDRANMNKTTYVLYARTNKANETKLAYCAADKWSGLTDRRIIGPVSTVSPE